MTAGPPSDTIVAIATPPGAGAIGIIRLSGPRAVTLASALLRVELDAIPARLLHRAIVIDPGTGAELDVALVVRMPAPSSYTGEDVVELSCHGNPVLLGEIVAHLVRRGARMAEPGEFTRRAYLNGRMDLLQVEAVAELIAARSERAVRLAARELRGGLTGAIGAIREALLDLVAGLEVALDFPEDEQGQPGPEVRKQLQDIAECLGQLIASARQGRVVQDGLSVMLIGGANVGKSSLLNALLGTDRAIVSATPGTTRDLVEGTIVIQGVPVRLADGAGLGPPRDAIDAEGMRRVRQGLAQSDLALVVLDRSRPMDSIDREVLALTENTERLIVVNKSDLPLAWEDPTISDCVCSALTGRGMGDIKSRLEAWVNHRTAGDGDEGGVVASLRVLERLIACRSAIGRIAPDVGRLPAEAVLVDLRVALAVLDAALGVEPGEAVLDRIFARFCVGK